MGIEEEIVEMIGEGEITEFVVQNYDGSRVRSAIDVMRQYKPLCGMLRGIQDPAVSDGERGNLILAGLDYMFTDIDTGDEGFYLGGPLGEQFSRIAHDACGAKYALKWMSHMPTPIGTFWRFARLAKMAGLESDKEYEVVA